MQQEIDMWVLARDRDVSVPASESRNRSTTESAWRASCLEHLRTTFMCHPGGTIARTEVIWPLVCQATDEAERFWSTIRAVRASFSTALASTLNRLCQLLPEAGADQMEIPVGADGDLDWPEALFPMSAALLTYLAERLQATQDSAIAGEAVHEALSDLALLLSDHLTDRSPFFDAVSRSVRVPSDKTLKSALSRGERLVLLPVRRISAPQRS